LKIKWSVENDCDKIIFSDETRIEVGADKKIYVSGGECPYSKVGNTARKHSRELYVSSLFETIPTQ
jgi:hypothetical protein